jgi:glycosyltransferase involved in cell wall biosynthesis
MADMSERQIKRRTASMDAHKVEDSKVGKSNTILTLGKASRIDKELDGIAIHINNQDLATIGVEEISHALETARGPIAKFFGNNGDTGQIIYSRPAAPNMIHFGIWMNNVKHYSGGRVHLTLMAYLLANMGHKVTIVTDNMPGFLNDLKFIDVGDRVEFISGTKTLDTNWLMKCPNNNIQVVIAAPRIYESFFYAKKWKLPCYAMLLETPNFVSRYRGGADSQEEYWIDYKKYILEIANVVLCNPGPTMEGAKEWLKDFKGEFHEMPPSINITAADKIADCEEENEITFIGRHLDFKCPDDVVVAVASIPPSQRPAINFIGSHNDNIRNRILSKSQPLNVIVRFYAGVDDYVKFSIIKKSKMLICTSKFEGFGMPPAEAIYCKKPVIAYDLPILRHVYGDSLIYVKSGDIKERIGELLNNPEKRMLTAEKAYIEMFSPNSNNPCLPSKIKNICRKVFYGNTDLSITAGIIVLNGADTLRQCLDSIYHSVDKIVIVEGIVEDYAKNNTSAHYNGHSIDGTIQLIQSYDDPISKIELVRIEDVCNNRKLWKSKNEMQNEIAKRIETALYVKVDSDEIWRECDLEYCRRLFLKDADLDVLYIKAWHFWKNLKTVAVGGQWDGAYARVWRWRKDFHHNEEKKAFNYFVDGNNEKVMDPKYKVAKNLGHLHYHLGYCRKDDQINNKLKYYANRGIEQNVENQYSNWKPGMPTNSTHPDGTTAIPFKGDLPFVLLDSYCEKIEPKIVQQIQNNVGMLNATSKEEEV